MSENWDATEQAIAALIRLMEQAGAATVGEALKADDLRVPLMIDSDRVRLGAASPNDLNAWCVAELDRLNSKWMESEAARNAAAWLIEQMREQDAHRVEDLRFSEAGAS